MGYKTTYICDYCSAEETRDSSSYSDSTWGDLSLSIGRIYAEMALCPVCEPLVQAAVVEAVPPMGKAWDRAVAERKARDERLKGVNIDL